MGVSRSLDRWQHEREPKLDEIENAHASVGGIMRGRRYATQQINQAYAVLLSSHLQGYCRDLHSECADLIVSILPSAALQVIVLNLAVSNRKLDIGNPNPGNIGADFNRLGIGFWIEVNKLDQRNKDRQRKLEQLNAWRNAIAHQDFDPAKLGGRSTLSLAEVQGWRSAVSQLVVCFDRVMYNYLNSLTGVSPW